MPSTRQTGTVTVSVASRPPTRQESLENLCRDLLVLLGEDPTRPGLAGTPERFARLWIDFTDYEPGVMDTTFEQETESGLVVVSGIRVWSYCEHHLLPFWCDLSIGYRPKESILGLSKFARIAHAVAHHLQVQERLVSEVADEVAWSTASEDVIVLGRGEHLCMTMRGIRSPALMTSTATRGAFRESDALRREFYTLAGGR